MKFKEVERSATIAWSPMAENPRMIAAGTVAGSFDINFNVSNKLEIFDVRGDGPVMTPVHSLETASGFTTLAWGKLPSKPLGLLAGGTSEGVVNLYNPAAFPDPEASVLCSQQKHAGAVQALDFNPFNSSLLASAGSDSEILIWDLGDPTKPSTYTPGKKVPSLNDVSCVAWNKKSQAILASTGYSGAVVIWDLRTQRPLLTFADQSRRAKWKQAAWSPTDPTTIITVCDEDEHPVVLWDLRNIHIPRYFPGHTQGVWSVTWTEHEPSMVVTSGKDRTLCWDPETLAVHSEVRTDSTGPAADWYAKAEWSPVLPATLALCSYGAHNPKICVHSMFDARSPGGPSGSQDTLQRPPKWMGAPAGAAFGFGGRIARFTRLGRGKVHVTRLESDEELLARAHSFESVVKDGRFQEFCERRAADTGAGAHERTAWKFIGLQFSKSVREELLSELGYNRETLSAHIAQIVEEAKKKDLLEKQKEKEVAKPAAPAAAEENKETEPEAPAAEQKAPEAEAALQSPTSGVSNLFADAADTSSDPFALITSAKPAELPAPAKAEEKKKEEAAQEKPVEPIDLKDEGEEESLIAKAVLVGDFESAVAYCERLGRHADALIIASCGGADLLARTRERYVSTRWKSSSMRLVDALTRTDLRTIVEAVVPSSWRVALAALCTYAKGSQFPVLTSLLGDRLAAAGDKDSAILCYIAAGNVDKAVDVWVFGHHSAGTKELQELVERITVLRHAVGAQEDVISEAALGRFMEYAVILSSQGRMTAAMNYISFLADPKFSKTAAAALLDRVRVSGTGARPAYRPDNVGGCLRAATRSIPRTAPSPQPLSVQTGSRQPGIAKPVTATPPSTMPMPMPMPMPVSKPAQPIQPSLPTTMVPKPASTFVPSPALPQPTVGPTPQMNMQPSRIAPVSPPVMTSPLQQPIAPPAIKPFVPAPHVPQTQVMSPIAPPNLMSQMGVVSPVAATTSRPHAEALITGQLSSIGQPKPTNASSEEIALIRGTLAKLLTSLQQAAAGTPHERHVADTTRKLDPFASQLPQLLAPTAEIVGKFVVAVDRKDWAAAENTLEAISRDHTKDLQASVVTGLRFLAKLYRQFP